MENNHNSTYVRNEEIAILGSLNGIVLDSLIWPYFTWMILQLIFLGKYNTLKIEFPYAISILSRIITIVITLGVAIFIAKPKLLIKAYKKLNKSSIKIGLLTLGAMFAFSIAYNLTLNLIGIDTTGGNANQSAIISMIKTVPMLTFLCTVVLAPIVEEITYRYFLYGGLTYIANKKMAIVISGFIFMALHAVASFSGSVDNLFREIVLLPPYMFSGMALAYAYEKSKNLTVSTTTHALNNLFSFILCLI